MLLSLFRRLLAPAVQRRSRPGTTHSLVVAAPLTTHSGRDLDALITQARASIGSNDLTSARVALEQALVLAPSDRDALMLLAMVSAERKEFAQAHSLLAHALAANPHDPQVHDALGNVLRLEGNLEKAIESYGRALAASPRLASALSNRALSLQELGSYDLARDDYLRALEADPSDLTIATNFAALLFDVGEFVDALARIEAVLCIDPKFTQAHVVKALGLLRQGKYAQGWIEYEWRDRNAGRIESDVYEYPEWDGAPMPESPLLICAEQGLGDQIMFASCIPDLSAIVPRAIIECDPRLKPLFSRSFARHAIYMQRKTENRPWLEDGVVPRARTWIGSLPMRFRRSANDFTRRGAFLSADPGKVDEWMQRLAALGPGLKIGVSWRGGTASTRQAMRSIELAEWLPLLQLSGHHVVSLQYGECESEIAAVNAALKNHIHHWEPAIKDYDETAALVCALDLVISVQTSIVHLAGALGKTTWVLVPKIAEWRYGEHSCAMPWYASVRIYRQGDTRNWTPVLSQVTQDLQQRITETPDV